MSDWSLGEWGHRYRNSVPEQNLECECSKQTMRKGRLETRKFISLVLCTALSVGWWYMHLGLGNYGINEPNHNTWEGVGRFVCDMRSRRIKYPYHAVTVLWLPENQRWN